MEEVDQHPHLLHPMEPATKRSRASETLTLTLAKSTDNVLTKHTFTEAIDHKMLQRMIDSGVLYRTNDGGWMDRESLTLWGMDEYAGDAKFPTKSLRG